MSVYGNLIEPVLSEDAMFKDIMSFINESTSIEVLVEARALKRFIDKIIICINNCIAKVKEFLLKSKGDELVKFFSNINFDDYYTDDINETVKNYIVAGANRFDKSVFSDDKGILYIPIDDITNNVYECLCNIMWANKEKRVTKEYIDKEHEKMIRQVQYNCTSTDNFYKYHYLRFDFESSATPHILRGEFLEKAIKFLQNTKSTVSQERYFNIEYSTAAKDLDEFKYLFTEIMSCCRSIMNGAIEQYKFFTGYFMLLKRLSNR